MKRFSFINAIKSNKIKSIIVAAFVIFGLSNVLSSESCTKLISSFLTNQSRQIRHTKLPESAIIIALGLDSKKMPLTDFAKIVESKAKRRVVTYRNFETANYTSLSGEWWNETSYEEATSIVELAVRRAVDLYPDKKIIVFNLDNYNPEMFFKADGTRHRSYTNFEIKLLLGEPHLFAATRWFSKGHELSTQQVKELLKYILVDLERSKPKS